MTKFKTIQELFSDPKRWIKGSYARDAQGLLSAEDSEKAVCFCLLGAIGNVYPPGERSKVVGKVASAIQRIDPDFDTTSRGQYGIVVSWNDVPERTIEEVRKVVEIAGV